MLVNVVIKYSKPACEDKNINNVNPFQKYYEKFLTL